MLSNNQSNKALGDWGPHTTIHTFMPEMPRSGARSRKAQTQSEYKGSTRDQDEEEKETMKKFVGKGWVVWFWLIVFFPIAIVYYFSNYAEPQEVWREI